MNYLSVYQILVIFFNISIVKSSFITIITFLHFIRVFEIFVIVKFLFLLKRLAIYIIIYKTTNIEVFKFV